MQFPLCVTVVESLILLRCVGEIKQACSSHDECASSNTDTPLMTPALTSASFSEGLSGEGARFNPELIIIIAPNY